MREAVDRMGQVDIEAEDREVEHGEDLHQEAAQLGAGGNDLTHLLSARSSSASASISFIIFRSS